MKLVFAALLLAGVLPLVCAAIAKWGFHHYDNHAPREWLARQTGYRARANAAQANSHEAFAFFAAALLSAAYAGVPASTLAPLAGLYVLSRIAYIACYVANRATWRSLCWLVGYALVISLFVLAIGAR
jgi:uncharacterized MAPEG superfamily protein